MCLHGVNGRGSCFRSRVASVFVIYETVWVALFACPAVVDQDTELLTVCNVDQL